MPTMREQVSALIKNNPDADYWEKLVLRLAEALLAQVEDKLRGMPVEEAGVEKMTVEDYENMPGVMSYIELRHGVPTPKNWNINIEGRHGSNGRLKPRSSINSRGYRLKKCVGRSAVEERHFGQNRLCPRRFHFLADRRKNKGCPEGAYSYSYAQYRTAFNASKRRPKTNKIL
jgi:hypothetical protein